MDSRSDARRAGSRRVPAPAPAALGRSDSPPLNRAATLRASIPAPPDPVDDDSNDAASESAGFTSQVKPIGFTAVSESAGFASQERNPAYRECATPQSESAGFASQERNPAYRDCATPQSESEGFAG